MLNQESETCEEKLQRMVKSIAEDISNPSVKDIIGYVKKFISFYFVRGPCIMSLNILY